METLKRDLRYALRSMRSRPGFTAIALLTIALGIGINTAIFSFVNGVLLRPLPFADPFRIAAIFMALKQQGGDLDLFSPSNFVDTRAAATSFDSVAAVEVLNLNFTGKGEPEAILGARVSHEFFRVLGIRPLLGRSIQATDDVSSAPPVAVLSYALWQQRFAGSPDVIGTTIVLDAIPRTIIGVVPKGAEFPEAARVWVPLALPQLAEFQRGNIYLQVIGRLKAGASLRQAKGELQAIASRLEAQYPKYNSGKAMTAVPLQDVIVGEVRPALLVLAAAVGFVLLIACANLANLLLADASARARELAVRAALGASGSRLVRQLLTEALLLSVVGAVIGILMCYWIIPVLKALSPVQLPRVESISIDYRVLSFALLISVISAFLFGFAPALGSSRLNLHDRLKEGRRVFSEGPQRKRLGSILIVGEVALVLVLLSGAGLLVRSFLRLNSVNPGFNPENLISFQVLLPELQYSEREKRITFYNEALEKIRGIPGVQSADVVAPPPFSYDSTVTDVTYGIEGQPPANDSAFLTRVSPEYFNTMQIPLKQGRSFTTADREDRPGVAIISETLARKYWPDRSAIGQRIQIGTTRPLALEVVGVAGDVKHLTLRSAVRPEIYLPFVQRPIFNVVFVMKTNYAVKDLLPALKSQFATIDKSLPVQNIFSIEQLISRSIAPSRASMFLMSAFAGFALLLALIGLYGLIAYSVAQRTQEIGVRMALGARNRNILSLILRYGMGLAFVGTAIGILASLGLTRFLSSVLFNVSPVDPLVLCSVSLVLLATALLACYLPAKRATKLDPVVALRFE